MVHFQLLGETPAASELSYDPDRLLAEARLLIGAGSAVDKVILDVSSPQAASTFDLALATRLAEAAESLADDPTRVREIIKELREFGLWRLTRDTDIDLEIDEVLELLVKRAGRRLSANLEI